MTAPRPAHTDYADLIARLEAATEGSRELDMEIWLAVSREPWVFLTDHDDTIVCHRFGPKAPGNPVCTLDPFSRSLDAALSLVPEGWVWQVRHVIQAQAIVWNLETDWDDRQPPTGVSEWPELALCIAALRAKGAAHD